MSGKPIKVWTGSEWVPVGNFVTAPTNLSQGSIEPNLINGTALTEDTVDARGDLLAATAADTVARLAVGVNGTSLVADSGQAAGLKWSLGSWRTESTTVTAAVSDNVVDVTGTTTVNLPAAATSTGKVLIVRNTGDATVTLDGSGAETVGGAATLAIAGRGYVRIVSNGTAWLVLDGTYTDESVGRRIFTWDSINSRWQMTYGDTGWRTGLGWFGADWDDANFFIRRINNTVCARGYVRRVTASGTPVSTTITGTATGFRASNHQWPVSAYSAAGNVRQVVILDCTNFVWGLQPTNPALWGTWAANDRLYFPESWTTPNAWPSSLPGTADGSIPS